MLWDGIPNKCRFDSSVRPTKLKSSFTFLLLNQIHPNHLLFVLPSIVNHSITISSYEFPQWKILWLPRAIVKSIAGRFVGWRFVVIRLCDRQEYTLHSECCIYSEPVNILVTCQCGGSCSDMPKNLNIIHLPWKFNKLTRSGFLQSCFVLALRLPEWTCRL